MHGNVWESTDSLSQEGAWYRVFRGGGWNCLGVSCSASNQREFSLAYSCQCNGFRLLAVPAGG